MQKVESDHSRLKDEEFETVGGTFFQVYEEKTNNESNKRVNFCFRNLSNF